MNVSELMTDALGRIPDLVHASVDGLSDDDLAWRPDPGANTIAWLVWHLTRIEDDHVADVAGTTQAWEGGWADRFALPLPVGRIESRSRCPPCRRALALPRNPLSHFIALRRAPKPSALHGCVAST